VLALTMLHGHAARLSNQKTNMKYGKLFTDKLREYFTSISSNLSNQKTVIGQKTSSNSTFEPKINWAK
jgi:hypothetical protein